MSYDLFLKPRNGVIDRTALTQYFANRPGYKTEGGEAWYVNEETGVYFYFNFAEKTAVDTGQSDDESLDETLDYPIAFNLNYYRPSFFVLEAEPEVTALVRQFGLVVMDPQMQGMGVGEYDPGKLKTGWHCGNETGYQAYHGLQKPTDQVFHLPGEQLEHIWRWNRHREQFHQSLGVDQFVPMIILMARGDQTVTLSVWPDGIPVAMPRVDYVCIPRKEHTPTRFFRKQPQDMVIVPWASVEPVLLAHGEAIADGKVISVNYTTPPAAVIKFVTSLKKEDWTPVRLRADQVLNRELYLRYASKP